MGGFVSEVPQEIVNGMPANWENCSRYPANPDLPRLNPRDWQKSRDPPCNESRRVSNIISTRRASTRCPDVISVFASLGENIRTSNILASAAALVIGSTVWAAPFLPGNLVVSRVGDGTGSVANNVANPVFLDEFTTAGASAGNTIALPTAASGANFSVAIGRSTTSAGQLQRSADGRYLLIGGTDAPVGTTNPNSNANFRGRTVARVDSDGNIDSSTRFEAPGTTIRSAYSTDGTDIYTTHDAGAGAPSPGGLRYMTLGQTDGGTLMNGATTNIRVAGSFNGQLYASASTGVGGDFRGVFSVGTGLPTTASAYSLLPGFGVLGGASNNGNSDSSYDFFFADSTTLYVTDDDTTAPASGGLQKWRFDGSAWVKLWTLTPIARSIAGEVDSSGNVSLYLITGDGTTLSSLSDTLSGATAPAAFSTLATAPANTVFRGVELAPIPEPTSLAAIAAAGLTLVRRRRA